MGRFFFHVMGALAEMERELLSSGLGPGWKRPEPKVVLVETS